MKTSYTLRHPTAADVWPMLRIIRKLGVKDFRQCITEDIKQKAKEATENGKKLNIHDIGMDVALNAVDRVIDRMPECEKEVYAFLSGLSGLKMEEIHQMPLSSFAEMIIDVIRDEEFSDFFTAVSKLL